jgi:cytochrome c oxidase accessory protein FixG
MACRNGVDRAVLGQKVNRENHEATSGSSEEVIRVLDLYETREKIYTRRLKGFFSDVKKYTLAPFLLAYFLVPWLTVDGRQAMWFDLPERKFHIFWMTFWPQDFMLLAWMLIICAFALFTVTVLVGRVWCGFSCPQTVWTLLFMVAEHFWEGDRNQRIKLDSAPWSANKIARKSGKHGTWLFIAFVTGFTFVGYFNPVRELATDFFTLQSHPAAYFWTFFFTFATYLNAGHLREQVCLYMCPYARFQSVMFDSDTLIVSYNYHRGEPRGGRKQGAAHVGEGLGDCVDCSLCVQVCPTGIDIRDGLQYECINCGLCIDACNSVMDKMGYPRELISFTTEHRMDGAKTRVLRPRLVGYTLILTAMIVLFIYTVSTRIPLEVDIIRDRSLLFRETSEGLVENIYTVKISNMAEQAHTYQLAARGDYEFEYLGEDRVEVAGGEVFAVLVRLVLDPGLLQEPNSKIFFEVRSLDDANISEVEESRFIGPSRGR